VITVQNHIPYVIINVTFQLPPKYQVKLFWHLQLILEIYYDNVRTTVSTSLHPWSKQLDCRGSLHPLGILENFKIFY